MIGATPPSSMCRGANLSPGKAPGGGCVSLRPIPRKALFFRREAQTLHREEPPGGCVSLRLPPGKALFFR